MLRRRNPSRKAKKTAIGSDSPPCAPKPPKKPAQKVKKTTGTSDDDVPIPTSSKLPQGPLTTEVSVDSRLSPMDLTYKNPSAPHKSTATSPKTPRRTSLSRNSSHTIRQSWITGPLIPTESSNYDPTHPTMPYFPHPGPLPTDPDYDPTNPQHTVTSRRRSQRVASGSSPTTVSFAPASPPWRPTSPPYAPWGSPHYNTPHSVRSIRPSTSALPLKAPSFSRPTGPPFAQAAAVAASLRPTSPRYRPAGHGYGPNSPDYPARVLEYISIERKGPAVAVTTVSRDEVSRPLHGAKGKRPCGDEGQEEGREKRVKREAERRRGGRRGRGRGR